MRAGDTLDLKTQGARLGRAGLSQRVIELVANFQRNPSYISAIILAGRLSAVATAWGSVYLTKHAEGS